MTQNAAPAARRISPLLRFFALGDWRPGEVDITWTPSTRRITSQAEALIDTAWRRTLARPGVKLFDGPMCRLESFSATPGRFALALSRTSYRVFLGTNLHNAHALDDDERADAVGVSPALLTADGYLLLGRRNGRVAFYPDHVHPFSGSLDPTPDDSTVPDLFAEIRRELREELHLEADEVEDVRVTGIAQDQALLQPEVIARCRSRLNRAEIVARLDTEEHTDVWQCPATPAAVAAAARPDAGDPTPFTPVARAALLLWGRTEFGTEWFDHTRAGWAETGDPGTSR